MGQECIFGDFDARRGNLPTYLIHFKWTFHVGISTPILFMGVAIDPTCINIGRLERTEPNLVHFIWGRRANSHFEISNI